MQYPSNAEYYDRPAEEFPAAQHQRESVNLQVKSLSLIATGTYNPQFARPYATDYNIDNKNELYETLNRSYFNYQQSLRSGQAGGSAAFEITPELVAGATSSFIMPSAVPEAQVNIVSGWGETRARFFMEVVVQRAGVGEQNYLILGYTDHYGISASAYIDPRMEFTINSIFEMRRQLVPTPMGLQEQTTLFNASQLLTNDNWSNDIHQNPLHRMRPEDVMSKISVSHIPDLNSAGISVVDARTRSTSVPVKSAYSHANPTNYLASILGGITSGQHEAAMTNRHGHVYNLAAATVADNLVARDPFLRAISQVKSSAMSSKFTYKDLVELDPHVNADHVTTIYQRDTVHMAGQVNRPGENLHTAGSTMTWNGTDRPTQVATKIANALPHLMIEMLISGVAIHSTNRLPGAQPNTFVSNVTGIVRGVDMTSYAEMLKQQFVTYLLNDITFNNQIGYEMSITADIKGEIWISLSLEGFPPVDYVAPAFASSLTSPVTTRNAENLTNLASNFETLQKEVFGTSFSVPQDNNVWTPPSGTRY